MPQKRRAITRNRPTTASLFRISRPKASRHGPAASIGLAALAWTAVVFVAISRDS